MASQVKLTGLMTTTQHGARYWFKAPFEGWYQVVLGKNPGAADCVVIVGAGGVQRGWRYMPQLVEMDPPSSGTFPVGNVVSPGLVEAVAHYMELHVWLEAGDEFQHSGTIYSACWMGKVPPSWRVVAMP